MSKLPKYSLIFGITMIFCGCALSGNTFLKGNVSNGLTPIRGAKIQIIHSNSKGLHESETKSADISLESDDDGNYKVELPPGDYTIITMNGSYLVKYESISINNSGEETHTTFIYKGVEYNGKYYVLERGNNSVQCINVIKQYQVNGDGTLSETGLVANINNDQSYPLAVTKSGNKLWIGTHYVGYDFNHEAILKYNLPDLALEGEWLFNVSAASVEDRNLICVGNYLYREYQKEIMPYTEHDQMGLRTIDISTGIPSLVGDVFIVCQNDTTKPNGDTVGGTPVYMSQYGNLIEVYYYRWQYENPNRIADSVYRFDITNPANPVFYNYEDLSPHWSYFQN